MVHILNWNCQGLNKPKRKTLLKEYMLHHNIEIVGVQKTKIESFTKRTLDSFSRLIDTWFVKPSSDNSGGILLGISSFLFSVTQT
jgi:exonuclease III